MLAFKFMHDVFWITDHFLHAAYKNTETAIEIGTVEFWYSVAVFLVEMTSADRAAILEEILPLHFKIIIHRLVRDRFSSFLRGCRAECLAASVRILFDLSMLSIAAVYPRGFRSAAGFPYPG